MGILRLKRVHGTDYENFNAGYALYEDEAGRQYSGYVGRGNTPDPDKFEISCSSVGGYDPTQDSSRLDYFIGLTTLSKYDVATELKNLLKSFSDYCYRQGNEIYRLENELENPPYNG